MSRIFYDLEREEVLFTGKTLEESLKEEGEKSLAIDCSLYTKDLYNKLTSLKNKVGKGVEIILNINDERNYLDKEEDILKLKEINQICVELDVKLKISLNEAHGDYEKFVIAREEIENFANKLKNMTINENGKQIPLSPIEKFYVVYRFVSNRVYKEAEEFGDDDMRNWIGVLSTDKVICSGFASLLKCVCDKVFTKEELRCYKQSTDVYDKKDGRHLGGHANNLIILHDQKYNIQGLYTSDACWGSPKERKGDKSSYEYCLNTIDVYGRHSIYDFEFSNSLFFYENIDNVLFRENEGYVLNDIDITKDLVEELGLDRVLAINSTDLEKEIRLKKEKEHEEKANEQIKIYDNKLQEIVKKHGLESIMEQEIIYFYPESIIKKYPEIKYFVEVMENLTVDNLEENLSNLYAYFEFMKIHKEDLYDKLFEKSKELGVCISIKVENYIKNNCYPNRLAYIDYKTIEAESNKVMQLARNNALKKGHNFINPPQIPEEAEKNGLRAVAMFEGITDETEIEKFVEEEMERTRKYRKEDFELTGINLIET